MFSEVSLTIFWHLIWKHFSLDLHAQDEPGSRHQFLHVLSTLPVTLGHLGGKYRIHHERSQHSMAGNQTRESIMKDVPNDYRGKKHHIIYYLHCWSIITILIRMVDLHFWGEGRKKTSCKSFSFNISVLKLSQKTLPNFSLNHMQWSALLYGLIGIPSLQLEDKIGTSEYQMAKPPMPPLKKNYKWNGR